jgi:ABC-2 type transport system ATP-binding protein
VEAKASIGYLPEIPPLYTDMTPEEYLYFVAEAKGVDPVHLDVQVEEVMEKTSLIGVRDRLIKNLSKGYKQRVGIAQAILGDPEIIILDEPTVGLDPLQIIEIRDLIKELGETHTVILSSHILGEIQAVCDHITIIARGKLIACDSKENLEKAYSRRYLELACRAEPAAVTAILAPFFPESALTFGADGEYTTAKADITENPIQPETIFEAFSKANLPLHRLTTTEGSLEDLFLELTREGGSES